MIAKNLDTAWKTALAVYAVAILFERADDALPDDVHPALIPADVHPALIPAVCVAGLALVLAFTLLVFAKPAGGALVIEEEFDPDWEPESCFAKLEALTAASVMGFLLVSGVVIGVGCWVGAAAATMPPWLYALGCCVPAVFIVGYHEGSRAQGDVYASLARGEEARGERRDAPGVIRYDPMFPSRRAMARPKSDGNLRARGRAPGGLDAAGIVRSHSSGKLNAGRIHKRRR